jgi:multiple sugar transport system permease protein
MNFRAKPFFTLVFYSVLILGLFFFIFPVLWAIVSSFKNPQEILKVPPSFFPEKLTNLANYEEVFSRTDFMRFILNSFLLCASVVTTSLFFSSLAGYGFAKFHFPLKEICFFGVIGVLMVPFQSVAVPLFINLQKLGLIDTFLGLLLPLMISAFGVLMMREGISTIPNDYIDAARIDGCSEFRIFHTIILPMAKPSLAALAIIKFMWTWNEFFWPLLVITTPSRATVTLGISYFSNVHFKEYHLIMPAAVLSMLPLFLLFAVLRKWMVEALSGIGLKG